MSQEPHPFFRRSESLRIQLGAYPAQACQFLPERGFSCLVSWTACLQVGQPFFYRSGFEAELPDASQDFFFAVGQDRPLLMTPINLPAAIPVSTAGLAAATIVKADNRKSEFHGRILHTVCYVTRLY